MSYFDGVKKGDIIWCTAYGDVSVIDLNINGIIVERPEILIKNFHDQVCVSMEGVKYGDKLQTYFWSDPHIVPPLRPKTIENK